MSRENENGVAVHGDAIIDVDLHSRLIDAGNSTEQPAFQRADLFQEPVTARPLWAHQERGLDELRDTFRVGFRRPVLQLATGGGKTRLAAEIILRSVTKGHRVAFVAPAISLVDQAAAAFYREGIGCLGVMQGDHPLTDPSQPVQIISAQTLARRQRPDVDLVLIDECHLLHRSILEWIKAEPDLRFIGLSATPWARGMGNFYDELVVVADIAELIARKVLVPPIVFAPAVPDLSGVTVRAGEFDAAELVARVNTAPIVGNVVMEWRARAQGRPTVTFAVDRNHARHLQERFTEGGIPAGYVDGNTPQTDRIRLFQALAQGEIKVIVNVDVMTAGVDIPEISCIVDCRPTRSEIRLVQAYGRGLRSAPGKVDCMVLDHAGNSLRHGLITDIRHDRLDRTKPGERRRREEEKRAPRVRRCDDCAAVIPVGGGTCPECGAVKHAHTDIAHNDDQRLVAFGSGDREKAIATVKEMLAFFGELKGYAASKKYKKGWAFVKFRERYGHPPPAGAYFEPAAAPSAATLNWIKSRHIAWVKSREAAFHA